MSFSTCHFKMLELLKLYIFRNITYAEGECDKGNALCLPLHFLFMVTWETKCPGLPCS